MPHCATLVMHVNVSGKDLSRPTFVPHIRAALQRHGLRPQQLVLEVTESTLMEHRDLALRALAELTALGVKVGIDDFGTGYSSLVQLHRLPFSELKIDKSFVMECDKDTEAVKIIRSIAGLAGSLGMSLCAEGVESDDAVRLLRTLNCETAQGFLIGRPVPVEEIGWAGGNEKAPAQPAASAAL